METNEKIELNGVVGYCKVISATPESVEVSFCVAVPDGVNVKWYDCYACLDNTLTASELKTRDKVHIVGEVKMEKYMFGDHSVGYLPKVIVNQLNIIAE